MENQQKPDETINHDEDVKFERDKEALIPPLTAEDSAQSNKEGTIDEIPVPAKEDTLGNSDDFPPLTELEKQPKLQDGDQSS